jgi:hypothetical protein
METILRGDIAIMLAKNGMYKVGDLHILPMMHSSNIQYLSIAPLGSYASRG